MLLSADSGQNAILVLLDLSADFNTVGHDILFSHLSNSGLVLRVQHKTGLNPILDIGHSQ